VGAEVNWGVRFETNAQVDTFLRQLADEVFNRMGQLLPDQQARHVTLSVKKKLYDGEASKYLGHGKCTDLSKSAALTESTSVEDKAGLLKICSLLLNVRR
jgi:DNA repair protein REV1